MSTQRLKFEGQDPSLALNDEGMRAVSTAGSPDRKVVSSVVRSFFFSFIIVNTHRSTGHRRDSHSYESIDCAESI